MASSKFIPQFDPNLHKIVEAFGFVPGDVVTLKVRAKSVGTIFICKAINEDPIIEVKRDD